MWVHAQTGSSKGTNSSVPAWLRADSGKNLIKQGEIVTGRQCGWVAQWSDCSYGMGEVLGGSMLGLGAAKGLSHQFRHGCEQIWGRILLSEGKLSRVHSVAR